MPVSLSTSNMIEQCQVEANSIDPPDNHIGRSDLLLTELIGISEHSVPDTELIESIKAGYASDKSWAELVRNPECFPQFSLSNGLILHMNDSGDSALVIPMVIHKGEGVRGLIIEITHKIVGHFGYIKTISYMHKHYWWSTINKDVERFCASCKTCQTTKQHTTKQHGLLHQLLIPDCPWSRISMDFVGPFPESLGKNYL